MPIIEPTPLRKLTRRDRADIKIGTCSWTDPTLTGTELFYPSTDMTAEERLAFCTEHFPIVKVDATYYLGAGNGSLDELGRHHDFAIGCTGRRGGSRRSSWGARPTSLRRAKPATAEAPPSQTSDDMSKVTPTSTAATPTMISHRWVSTRARGGGVVEDQVIVNI